MGGVRPAASLRLIGKECEILAVGLTREEIPSAVAVPAIFEPVVLRQSL
jgi:hypothetical protein